MPNGGTLAKTGDGRILRDFDCTYFDASADRSGFSCRPATRSLGDAVPEAELIKLRGNAGTALSLFQPTNALHRVSTGH